MDKSTIETLLNITNAIADVLKGELVEPDYNEVVAKKAKATEAAAKEEFNGTTELQKEEPAPKKKKTPAKKTPAKKKVAKKKEAPVVDADDLDEVPPAKAGRSQATKDLVEEKPEPATGEAPDLPTMNKAYLAALNACTAKGTNKILVQEVTEFLTERDVKGMAYLTDADKRVLLTKLEAAAK